jgi:hypothetical protein
MGFLYGVGVRRHDFERSTSEMNEDDPSLRIANPIALRATQSPTGGADWVGHRM